MEIQVMDRKIEGWKKELLDTSKRNKMISYKENNKQTLKILEPGAKELFNLLAIDEKTLTFQRPLSKNSDFRTYAILALFETLSYSFPIHEGDIKASGTIMERDKTLKKLKEKTRLAQEEQGTNILYLSFGFILWKENNNDNSQWLKSPLLMMPVRLGVKSRSMNAPYTLSKDDDEIEVNPTLAYLFNKDYGIDLPEFELENKASFENYLEQIEEIIDKNGWKLVREASLGLLSFLKIGMYHDLNDNRERIINNPVIRAMSGDRHALEEISSGAGNADVENTHPKEWHEVVDSDSSQEEAIRMSKSGVSFVMQGPPGTGKSQTITNIIAEALGDGKKVLFVAEKAAALQVVLKRLTDAGLDDFCLSLHDYKANKKEIIDNIGKNLNMSPEYVNRSIMAKLTQLFNDRQYLNDYAEELHKKIEPFGESVYTAFGRLANLSDADEIDFELEDISKISKEQYSSIMYTVEIFEKALQKMDGKLDDNPWADTTAASYGQVFESRMIKTLDGFAENLKKLEDLVTSFNNEYGTSVENTWSAVCQSIKNAEKVLDLPLFPVKWRNAEYRKMLCERALREENNEQAEQSHAKKLAESLHKIERGWEVSLLGLSAQHLGDICDNGSLWAGDDKSECTADSNDDVHSLEVLKGKAENIAENYSKAGTLLRIAREDYPSAVLMVSRILHILKDAPEMNAEWFDIRKSSEYISRVEEIKNRADAVRQNKNQLLEICEPGIFEIDAEGMLARFRTDYTGMFHKRKGNYKADMKQIKMLYKVIGAQIGEPEAIAILQKVASYNTEKKWFTDNETGLKAEFLNYYKGLDTDWDKVLAGIRTAGDIAKQFPYGGISADVIEAVREINDNIQFAAEVRKLADLLEEDIVNDCLESLQDAGFISDSDADVSFSETLILKINERIERQKAYSEWIKRMDTAKKEGNISYAVMKELFSDISVIRQECIWFEKNISDILSEKDMKISAGDKPIWQEIEDAKLILKKHDMISKKDETEELRSLFGNRYTGNFTDWQSVIRDIDTVEAFEKENSDDKLNGFINVVADDESKRIYAEQKIQEFVELFAAAEPKFDFFADLFQKSGIKEMHFGKVAEKYNKCINSFDDLNKWLDYAEAKENCDKQGLSSFTDQIALKNNCVKDVVGAFEKGFYMQWLKQVIDDVPAVKKFRRIEHEIRLDKFIKLDEEQFEFSKERIRDSIIKTFPDIYKETDLSDEIRILNKEMNKKRRVMPLRKLFHEIPHLLLTLKPCFMMSPLSVAYFLNAEDYHFDMVIFDEASQIFPQDAIGAIFRADQTIIAGDTWQLPPTDFFSKSTANNDDDYYDDNDDDFEYEVYDSILEEVANLFPNRTLLWHYRSKHEHLIAFSNQEIYRNELVTFPSSNESEPDTGVEFVFVEDGYYEGSGKNRNEAKKCVELVKEHIDKHPERSLGIIAFGSRQQQAISDEIQRFREQNPKYEDFFIEDKEEAFFVKNLENVQGDERDSIFFSVGYAKTKEQKVMGKPMAMRFGPLGNYGGERRLNVAITRAKINVKLVSSILPSDIDLSKTGSEGIHMLRSYMEFARSEGATLASANQSRVPDDFVNAVYKYICARGYKARKYIGCSGYRIDIAVEHPEKKEFAAGIECDGFSYALARTARDRDRLRGSVLKNMGWNLYRVWSVEWYRNPEAEGNKLIEFIDAAINNRGEQKAASVQKIDEVPVQKIDKAPVQKIDKVPVQKADKIPVQKTYKEQEKNYTKEAPKEMQVRDTSNHIGTVKSIGDKYIMVKFWDGEKKFNLDAFEKGELKIVGYENIEAGQSQKETKISSDDHDLYENLVAAGFQCIDNRESSSIIWVLHEPDRTGEFKKIIGRYRMKYTLEKRGAINTNNKPAWRIMMP